MKYFLILLLLTACTAPKAEVNKETSNQKITVANSAPQDKISLIDGEVLMKKKKLLSLKKNLIFLLSTMKPIYYIPTSLWKIKQ